MKIIIEVVEDSSTKELKEENTLLKNSTDEGLSLILQAQNLANTLKLENERLRKELAETLIKPPRKIRKDKKIEGIHELSGRQVGVTSWHFPRAAVSENYCGNRTETPTHQVYSCMRDKNHDGPHVAHSADGRAIARWV